MNEVLEKISKIGIVPVVVLDDAKDAKPLAEALIKGGLPCAEVTFRTAAAEESIRIMASEFPEMLVGAGTVLTTEQVDRAVNAGAKFIVSSGLNPKVVKYCLEKGVPVTPGTANPSDVEAAIELGLEVVKFFPAEADSVASKFDNLFGFTKKVGNSSIFAGIEVEAMKNAGRGANGHIAIGTNSVVRAKNYLESVKGVKFIEESASVKNGKLTAIYMEEEIGGFAVHLVQK